VGRAFSDSYLAGEPAARAFFAPGFRDPAERQARARIAASRKVAPALLEVLREQQAALPASTARQENLDALARGQVAVVATGQQVGLFLGPLYTFYKAASAIAVARAVQAESGIRCVPLFWLQTEDHDFDEIRSCTVAGPDGKPAALELAAETQEESRVSMAHRRLGPEIESVLAQLNSLLDGQPGGAEVLAILRAQYRPGQPLAAAFAGVLATLFADEGLIFLDPRDPRVASLAAPIFRTCIEDAELIEQQLKDRQVALLTSGFSVQVPIRANCPLVFFHQGSARGPRFRLQKMRGPGPTQWGLAGSTEIIDQVELLNLLTRDPLRFSTSALLRPIVQDALLPTVAYVGGPGEINYFAELGPLYQHFDVAPPLLVPRARFRCLDARTRRWLQQSGLGASDLSRPAQEIGSRLARPAGFPDPQELRDRIAGQILPAVEAIASAISATGEHLQRPAQRTRDSVAHALELLMGRYTRGLVERDEATRRRLEQLQNVLNPGGVAQERVYGWPWLAGKLGVAQLKGLVMQRLEQSGSFVTEVLEILP
jgi:bacillithiol biosynthesis cysteine-adding enzyme BshC